MHLSHHSGHLIEQHIKVGSDVDHTCDVVLMSEFEIRDLPSGGR
jgi:hypothetical protein